MNYQVVVSTFNGERHIAEQLHSIIRQNPAPEGIIVSDDGSSDNTLTIVKTIAHSCSVPITLLNGPKRGVNHNILFALQHTSAPYVLIADQDDIWLDNKAALFTGQMLALQQPHLILDRKSTRLNSSHVRISYAVFCLKKK